MTAQLLLGEPYIGGTAMSLTDTKSVVQRYFDEIINLGHFDHINDLFAPNLVEFTRTNVTRTRTAFPDAHIAICDQIAEGDKVATVWTLTGTHQGAWDSPMGVIAPTGRPVSYTGTTCLRITDGKIVE